MSGGSGGGGGGGDTIWGGQNAQRTTIYVYMHIMYICIYTCLLVTCFGGYCVHVYVYVYSTVGLF